MPNIKIRSFKNLDNNEKEKEKDQKKKLLLRKEKIILNIIVDIQQKQQSEQIKELERWIRKQFKQKINYIRLLQQNAILQSIKTIINTKHVQTLFITNKPFNPSIYHLIKANQTPQFQQLIHSIQFIILTKNIQFIQPSYFWINNISLITTKIQQIYSLISFKINKHQAPQSIDEASSINSQDKSAFQEQFLQAWNPISLPKQQPIPKFDKKIQIIFNQNPGVGAYNISNQQTFKGTNTTTFNRAKR